MKLNEGRTSLGLTSKDVDQFEQLIIKANELQFQFEQLIIKANELQLKAMIGEIVLNLEQRATMRNK